MALAPVWNKEVGGQTRCGSHKGEAVVCGEAGRGEWVPGTSVLRSPGLVTYSRASPALLYRQSLGHQ